MVVKDLGNLYLDPTPQAARPSSPMPKSYMFGRSSHNVTEELKRTMERIFHNVRVRPVQSYANLAQLMSASYPRTYSPLVKVLTSSQGSCEELW